MSLAILCSGQGTQHREMFALTGEVAEASFLFARAANLLGGRDPRDMVRTDHGEALHTNRVAQILCSLQALSAVTALRDAMPQRRIIAGYSVGEAAAWGVAGFFSMTDTLDLVARRAEVMSAASSPGDGLLFVRGLGREIIERVCARNGAAIAIVEPGVAFVVGAGGDALRSMAEQLRMMSATVIQLPVAVASHTPRLAGASSVFREIVSQVHVTAPPAGTRLLSGIDGLAVTHIEAGLDKLSAQISQTVQWAACLRGCIEAGATAFLEVGPGHALSDMASHAYPDVPARCLDDFKTLGGAQEWLARQASH